MKQLTVNIEENKYAFFLELIKSMDFISIENDVDWYETLSLSAKKNIEKGLEDIENGRIHSHDDVMKIAKKRITALKNS
jgi:predicted transcriptional regulator